MPDTQPRAGPKPFACHGGEKMLYDVRSGPVALLKDGTVTVAYQANADGAPAHPHLIQCDLGSGVWSQAVQIGRVERVDHHFAPIIWFDHDDRLHALYGCHGRSGTHVVTTGANEVSTWDNAPEISASISYPHMVRLANGRLLLYYRTLGHMGYWGYRVSDNGGFSWGPPCTLVDMDRDPVRHDDCWAGSYHSVLASPDGRSLHIAFVYLDEARRMNPIYRRRFTSCRTLNRYSLYYMKLDVESGRLCTADGQELQPVLNRQAAEAGKIWDTGWRLTNMPAIWSDPDGHPSLLVPVSGESPWEVSFHLVRWDGSAWHKHRVADTNSTWCGAMLTGDSSYRLQAFVAAGKSYGELLGYGGGELEEWTSADGGENWTMNDTLVPEASLIYNNPRPIEHAWGGPVEDTLLCFAWDGPGWLGQAASRRPFPGYTGRAFMRVDGKWV